MLLLMLGCAAVPACSDSIGIADVLGIWNTESINGYVVPGTVVYEGDSLDTQYVRWAFYEGGQCTLTQRVDGVTATFDECDYTVDVGREAISIVFQFEAWDGALAGNRITLTDPQDVVWMLRPQSSRAHVFASGAPSAHR